MKTRKDKLREAPKVRISVSRDDLVALAARAKNFRHGSSLTALNEMAEAQRRDRAMRALLVVLAKTRPHVEDAEPPAERKGEGRGKSPKRERHAGRQHSRWTDDD